MSRSDNEDFDELKELIDSAFPDLRCLRCGNDAFLLASDVDALGTGRADTVSVLRLQSELAGIRRPVLTLACTRCGHLEHHVVGMLAQAAKPITRLDDDG